MLSVFLLCIAMFSAAWAYTSMMKSGEFTMGGMPVKYKIILIIYIIVAFFILLSGGPIVFIIYAAIAGIGSACGWFFTKNNEDDNTGKQELRIPVRLQVIDNANITDYTKKTNANNMLTTAQQSDNVNKITQQSTNSNASTAGTDNNNDNTTTTSQLESDSDNDNTSNVNASVSNHVNTDKNDSDSDNAR